MKSYQKSEEWLAQARRWTPGASQTGSKAPGRSGPLVAYPLFAEKGRDQFVYDVDGHKYIDMIGGLACVGIGHAQEEIIEAIHEILIDGGVLSLPTPEEALAAEDLCINIGLPYAEQVRFVKTGSEATEAAIRVARCATGRMRILTVGAGYHSWHAWFQAVKPDHPGVPTVMSALIDGFRYGEIPYDLLKTREYACVILEALPITGMPDGWDATRVTRYLAELKAAAQEFGTLLVFDEVVWGFRMHESGAGGFYGVVPDMATFGKAIANGVPIGALVGPIWLMQHASVVSGTFGGDRIGLAALRATLDIYRREQVCDHMRRLGETFAAALQSANADVESDTPYTIRATGDPTHPVVRLHLYGADARADTVAWSLLLQELAGLGVLYHPAGGNMMHRMTAQDMYAAAAAFAQALQRLNCVYHDGGSEGVRLALIGEPYVQAFARAQS